MSQQDPQPQPPAEDFETIAAAALSRRAFVQLGTAGSCAAFLGLRFAGEAAAKDAIQNAALQNDAVKHASTLPFSFPGVLVSERDSVVVPEGYVAQVLYRWGDPINGTAPQFKPDASNTADEQLLQAGMGHDGMEFFQIPGVDPNTRGLLAINHEYVDQGLLFPKGLPAASEPMTLEQVRKSQAAHGISIIEIARSAGGEWSVVKSSYSRRLTANSEAIISGPATAKIGAKVLGTCNNCSAGRTPWGTYLTCEENFQDVFGSASKDFKPNDQQAEYGLEAPGFVYEIDGKKISGYRWWEHDKRFDLAAPECDAERFGYVVEIDPYNPKSTPVKRTALGRFRHENAALTLSKEGRVVVYMGDDERGKYLFKYVSRDRYDAKKSAAENARLLDEGTLHAARFEKDGAGKWLALVPGQNGIPKKQSPDDAKGFDLADCCVYARLAAKIAGATPMDRPEWVAVDPKSKEVFATLTNNNKRGDKQPVDAANPRKNNIFGHIIRWREADGDPASDTFHWDFFALAGDPQHAEAAQRGNVKGDLFACPDGLTFDPRGFLWVQTDVSGKLLGTPEFEAFGNNMMLAADPITGETRRFLTGPNGCEVSGLTFTPDRTTMFVNIQHPGEPADDLTKPTDPKSISSWPDGPQGGRPRAATVAVRRKDGRPVGN